MAAALSTHLSVSPGETPALFDHFGATHVGLCRGRRQAHWVDLGPHLELLAEHDHGDVVVQRDVVELRVNVDLLGAVELALLGRLEGDVAQPNADFARLVGDVDIITILEKRTFVYKYACVYMKSL